MIPNPMVYQGAMRNESPPLKLAMLGMVDGNGHPYSWSAIFNGYDKLKMQECPYPGIPAYLNPQPPSAFGIGNARVTHIWCEDHAAAKHVATCSLIPNVVRDPLDVIGEVDAVIISTDIGHEHVQRVAPFLEAGLPAFIDKPLTDNLEGLRQFVRWKKEGKRFLSSSAMRYAVEFEQARNNLTSIGDLRLLTITTMKSWERYGIHALEGVYPFLQPGGWLSVQNTGVAGRDIIHVEHTSGALVILAAIADIYGSFGCLNIHGTKAFLATQFKDTFTAFKRQLVAFHQFLVTGEDPFPFSETIELMKIIIAGIMSRNSHGAKISLAEMTVED